MTGRGRRSLLEVSESARAIADHLIATPEVRRAATVAAYVSIGTEPGTGPLLDALVASGRRVILPVVLPDLDLDWAVYDGQGGLARARGGCSSPPGSGSASTRSRRRTWCSPRGSRSTARGCGWARAAAATTARWAGCRWGRSRARLLYADELLDAVPAAAHDRPVTAVATPAGVSRLRRR